MQVTLTPAQEAFVRQAMRTGRLDRPEDAVAEALLLWEERERAWHDFIATLDEARAEIARNEATALTADAVRAMAEDVKRRGRARLQSSGPAST